MDKQPGAFICLGTIGKRCGVDLLWLENADCGAHEICKNRTKGDACVCDPKQGFEGEQGHCTEIDECEAQPCQNGGICKDKLLGFECTCAPGYAGEVCSENIDECSPEPCVHGVCEDGVNMFTCDCTGTGYDGALCDTVVTECGPNAFCNTSEWRDIYPCADLSTDGGDPAGYTCRGQFADWPLADPDNRFILSSEVVVDQKTGFEWQRVLELSVHTWEEAKTYCLSLLLVGGGWRLPTKAELESIADITVYDPAIDTAAFPDTPSEFFWSSSPYVLGTGCINPPECAWGLSFGNGGTSFRANVSMNLVRCVR
jgi:hypothetical protein